MSLSVAAPVGAVLLQVVCAALVLDRLRIKAKLATARDEASAARAQAAAAQQEVIAAKQAADAARAEAVACKTPISPPESALVESEASLIKKDSDASTAAASNILSCETPLVPSGRRRRSRLQAQVTYEASEAVANALVDCLENISHHSPALGRVAHASSLLRKATTPDVLDQGEMLKSQCDEGSSYQPLLASMPHEETTQEAESCERKDEVDESAAEEDNEDEDEGTSDAEDAASGAACKLGVASGYLPFITGGSPQPMRRSAFATLTEEHQADGDDAVDWSAVREEVRTTAQLVYERILATAAMLEKDANDTTLGDMAQDDSLTLDAMLAEEEEE